MKHPITRLYCIAVLCCSQIKGSVKVTKNPVTPKDVVNGEWVFDSFAVTSEDPAGKPEDVFREGGGTGVALMAFRRETREEGFTPHRRSINETESIFIAVRLGTDQRRIQRRKRRFVGVTHFKQFFSPERISRFMARLGMGILSRLVGEVKDIATGDFSPPSFSIGGFNGPLGLFKFLGFEWAPSIKILDIDYGFELPGAGPFTQLWSVIKEQDQLETKRYPVQGLTTRIAPSVSLVKVTCGTFDKYRSKHGAVDISPTITLLSIDCGEYYHHGTMIGTTTMSPTICLICMDFSFNHYQADQKNRMNLSPMLGALLIDYSDQVRNSTVVKNTINISSKLALMAVNSNQEYRRNTPKPSSKKANRYLDDNNYAMLNLNQFQNFTLPFAKPISKFIKKIMKRDKREGPFKGS